MPTKRSGPSKTEKSTKAISPVEKASQRYLEWLSRYIFILDSDLARKYEKMREDAGGFVFFRGTFYRWASLWEEKRRDLRDRGVLIAGAPEIWSVGDLHVENFGTWRDREGRLIWGINDVDEAYPMRYMNDLVRLTTSAFLAMAKKQSAPKWQISRERVCESILSGYGEALKAGGRPFIMERAKPWLWKMATSPSRSPEEFMEKLKAKIKPLKYSLPASLAKKAQQALRRAAPREGKGGDLFRRRAGVGSLGRPRVVQFFTVMHGEVIRETKAVAPSACVFAGYGKPAKNGYRKILSAAVRIPDPFFSAAEGWVTRRLAFDSDKIGIDSLASLAEAEDFFRAMGAETANLHLSDPEIAEVPRHLQAQNRKRPDWLLVAAQEMVDVMKKDFADYLQSPLGRPKPSEVR